MTSPFFHLALVLGLGMTPRQAGAPGPVSGEALFGWPWGTTRHTIARTETLECMPSTEAGVERCRTEHTAFGEARLRDCDFEFVRERLAGVVITTRGGTNSHALLRELRRLFGPGQEEDPRGVGWLTETTHARYDEDSAGDAYVYIYARRITTAPGATAPDPGH